MAIHKRFRQPAVAFLKACLALLLKEITLCSIINQKNLFWFSRLLIADSTQWQIHRALRRSFRGSGGAASKAVCKLQTVIEPLTGKIAFFDYLPGTKPDQGYLKNIAKCLLPTDLILLDLGYYSVEAFKEINSKGAFFVIPVYYNASVQQLEDRKRFSSVAARINNEKSAVVDIEVIVGTTHSMPLRLVAVRVAEEKADRLRRKLRHDYRHQRRGTPPKERLRFCNCTVLITNVPDSMLSAKQIADLYSTRWQIEIFFRDAKSILKLDLCTTTKKERFEVQLLAVLFVAALLYYCHRSFNSSSPQREISLNKLCKRFCENARPFATYLANQNTEGFSQATSLLKDIIKISIKYRQPSRTTPIQILESLFLS